MPTIVVCPGCATRCDAEGSGGVCPVCGAALVADDLPDEGPTRVDAPGSIRAARRKAQTLSGVGDEDPDATRNFTGGSPGPVPAPSRARIDTDVDESDSTRVYSNQSASHVDDGDAHEPTLGFVAPSGSLAVRSSSALRLQTLMSEAWIAEAIKRLRARVKERPHGLKTIVDLAVIVTLADGEIDEIELIALHETVAIVVGELQTGLARHLINTCVAGVRERGLEACAHEVRDALIECDAVEDGLTVAYAAAFASDGLSISERGVIESLSDGTSIAHDRSVALREKVRASAEALDVGSR